MATSTARLPPLSVKSVVNCSTVVLLLVNLSGLVRLMLPVLTNCVPPTMSRLRASITLTTSPH